MRVNLTNGEVLVLRGLLDRHLGDMSAEISHTDNPTFRARLREEREALRAVRTKLDHETATPAQPAG